MKRLALLMLVAFASTAGAANRYVTTGAAGGGDGSIGTPWKLSEANTSAAAGDVVYVGTGTYATAINPTNGSLTASRITFLPLATSAWDTTVVVAGITLNRPGITVRGIKSSASVTLNGTAYTQGNYARSDSIVSCVIEGSLYFQGAKACAAYRDSIRGEVWFTAEGGCKGYSSGNYQFNNGGCDALENNNRSTDSCGVRACAIRSTLSANNETRFFSLWAWTGHCVIDSNAVSWINSFAGTETSNPAVIWLANSHNNSFRYNVWKFSSVNTTAHQFALYVRDSSSANEWIGDSFQEVGTGQRFEMDLCASGSFTSAKTIRRNSMVGCDIRLGKDLQMHDQTGHAWNLFGNLIASHSGNPLSIVNGAIDSTNIRQNTFAALGGDIHGGSQVWIQQFNGACITNGKVARNAFVSRLASTLCGDSIGVSVLQATSLAPSAIFADSNAYFSYAGDSTKAFYDKNGGCKTVGTWVSYSHNDSHSRWFDPSVHDSSWATLNLHPLTFSSPLLAAYSGAYIGAYSDTGSTSGGGSGPWTITASAGSSGSISPIGAVSVVNGTSQAFSITPATNYHVWDVLVDGASVGAVTSYTFTNVTASHTISCTFSTTDPPITPGRQLINATCNCPN